MHLRELLMTRSQEIGKRCKHPNARLTELRGNMATIRCDDCVLVLHTPRVPYVSNHACRRVHKAPKWAQRLIDAHTCGDSGACSLCAPRKAQAPSPGGCTVCGHDHWESQCPNV